ncbi:MAG: hypothetical protein ACHQ2Y_04340 [Candidatus Lutacidiplasmatales archaeon]
MSDWQHRESKAKSEAIRAIKEGAPTRDVVEKLCCAALGLGVEQGAAYVGEQLRDEQRLEAGVAGPVTEAPTGPRSVTLDDF